MPPGIAAFFIAVTASLVVMEACSHLLVALPVGMHPLARQGEGDCLKKMPGEIEHPIGVANPDNPVVTVIATAQLGHQHLMRVDIDRHVVKATVARHDGDTVTIDRQLEIMGHAPHIDTGGDIALVEHWRID